MKRFPFLQVALMASLMVVAASCGMPMGATGEYYEDAPVRRNVYSGRPYYGNNNVVIVERDPYTGRYYEVSPYGGVYNAPYGRYPGTYRTNGGRYNNRSYDSYPRRNSGTYERNESPRRENTTQRRDNSVQQQPQAQQESQRRMESAKESILGARKN